ncbi:MAG: AAA family ATPase [Lentisphaerae bacterium]|nr:AAA family ATPase [Lentisphaerota bacterium]
MKILKIRFENLNSLRGEWEVDFTAAEYGSNGIFAITGPTGSGKTTILDAICLALYGRTPRLARVNKSTNEIMTRQSGSCYAEVTFETKEGRYRCNWGQHRARKKAAGELQPARHELVDDNSGNVISESLTGVAEKVAELTGMDFDRFSRTIMLAQGGFAAFLLASPSERAPLLEQITGTEVYRNISKKVHERDREEKRKLAALQETIKTITVMSSEEEQEVRGQLQLERDTQLNIGNRKKVLDSALAWLQAMEKLQQEVVALEQQQQVHEADVAEFAPQRELLARGERALKLSAAYAELKALRNEQQRDSERLNQNSAARPALEEAVKTATAHVEALEQNSQSVSEKIREKGAEWQAIRELDSTIANQQGRVGEEEQKLLASRERYEATERELNKVQGELNAANRELATSQEYLADHAGDKTLVRELSGIEGRVESVAGLQRSVDKENKKLKTAEISYARREKELAARRAESVKLEERRKLMVTARDVVRAALTTKLADRTLQEYRDDYERLTVELMTAQRVVSYEEERRKLSDGQPCPLCGALEHPYALGNTPEVDRFERELAERKKLVTDIETLQNKLAACEADLQGINGQIEHKTAEVMGAAERVEEAETAVADAHKEAEEMQEELQRAMAELQQKVAEYGVVWGEETDANEVLTTLQQRFSEWQRSLAALETITEKQAKLKNRVTALTATAEEQKENLKGSRGGLDTMRRQLKELKQERDERYGERRPEVEEQDLNRQVDDLSDALRLGQKEREAKQRRCDENFTQSTTLRQQIEGREPQLSRAEGDFSAGLLAGGFTDESDYSGSLLAPDTKDGLQHRERELNERGVELRTRLVECRGRLGKERERALTEQSEEDLTIELQQVTESLNEVSKKIIEIDAKLLANEQAKLQIEGRQEEIERQRQECSRWGRLHELIGSADGKKYQMFAQGLTFEIMVGYANLQLQKLTERYLLVRDNAEPLELNVVDNYQAGEVRSTKNLSGGESFIVSLALALGLSRMVSSRVSVDSLFLDEGFGTLDDDALESALGALASLQNEGKLIGLISHVAALKERIPTQIEIVPQSGGWSHISGPGCRKH